MPALDVQRMTVNVLSKYLLLAISSSEELFVNRGGTRIQMRNNCEGTRDGKESF